MKILVIGKGWLGTLIAQYLGADLSSSRLNDISVAEAKKYDLIINAAAKTNIDWCEKNHDATIASNITEAVALAKVCKEAGVRCVFISSACIFNSTDEHDIKYEDSVPNPLCFYAETKAESERHQLAVNPNIVIIRIRVPLSETPHPRNTITKILGYKKLVNTRESVTVIEDMLPALQNIVEGKDTGVFHLINEGTTSMPEIVTAFGDRTFEVIDRDEFQKMIKEADKATRVSTVAGSRRTPYLPPISKRIPHIVAKYKSKL